MIQIKSWFGEDYGDDELRRISEILTYLSYEPKVDIRPLIKKIKNEYY